MKHEDFVEKIKATPAYAELLPIHGERLFIKGQNGDYNILAIRLAWQLLGGKERHKHHNVEIHKEYSGNKLIEREVQLRGGWLGVNWSEAPEEVHAWEASEDGAKWIILGENMEDDTLVDAPLYGYNKAFEDSYTLKPAKPRWVIHPDFNARFIGGAIAAFADGTFATIMKIDHEKDLGRGKEFLALSFCSAYPLEAPKETEDPYIYELGQQGFFTGKCYNNSKHDILYLME